MAQTNFFTFGKGLYMQWNLILSIYFSSSLAVSEWLVPNVLYIGTADQCFICICYVFQCISQSSQYTNTMEIAVTVQFRFLVLYKNHDVADFLDIFLFD